MSDDIILVLGGARSGKSRFAEDLVINQRNLMIPRWTIELGSISKIVELAG